MEARKVGTYGIAGITLAALIVSGLYLSGLQFPGFATKKGNLVVLLTDAPVDIDHLNITIDSLSVKLRNESWIPLPFLNDQNEVYFDLLALYNVTMELSDAKIPVGNYTKLRMTVKTANATLANNETLDLTVPPGHIDVIIKFEIESDDVTVVLVDMQADWVAISKSNHLRPVLKASVA
ncbi:MAG: DUF4382 domain-containing protein [Candidatus Bathyarchaeota archaeon]|nr:MAG: DUF4382 domain-containing protein [Candidatus Bathyarchaeota archaeon]